KGCASGQGSLSSSTRFLPGNSRGIRPERSRDVTPSGGRWGDNAEPHLPPAPHPTEVPRVQGCPDRPRSDSPGELGFRRRSMVRWLDPGPLVAKETKAIISGVFGSHADRREMQAALEPPANLDRKSTRLNSSHEWISYAVFC